MTKDATIAAKEYDALFETPGTTDGRPKPTPDRLQVEVSKLIERISALRVACDKQQDKLPATR